MVYLSYGGDICICVHVEGWEYASVSGVMMMILSATNDKVAMMSLPLPTDVTCHMKQKNLIEHSILLLKSTNDSGQ